MSTIFLDRVSYKRSYWANMIYVPNLYNTMIPWLLSAERDNARTEGEGEHGTKLSPVYYVL